MKTVNYFPLGPAQRSLAFLFRIYPETHILNLAARMDFDEQIDEELMLKAVRETEERLTFLKVRLHMQDEDTMVQYICEDEPEPTELVDLSGSTQEEVDKALYDWTYDAFPNSILDVPLYRFKLVRGPGGKQILYFCVQHFIADGYTILFTLQYLDRVYGALASGAELPEPTPEPWDLVKSDLLYHTSERYQKDLKRAQAEFDSEPFFTSFNAPGAPEYVEGRRFGRGLDVTQLEGGFLSLPIPAELTAKVNESAKELNVSPSNYYLLALREYLARVCSTEDVTILTTLAASRLTKYEKTCGLNFATQQFLRTVVPAETGFAEALVQLAIAQNNMLRHARAHSVDMLRWLHQTFQVPIGFEYYSVEYAYLPLFDLSKTNLKFKANYVCSGQTNQPCYVVILPGDREGGLTANYVYSLSFVTAETLERFHGFMLRFLENGLNAPEKSLGSLVDESL